MTIRVVLDTTAVRAFARGSVDVGELIAEVCDEGASFGVPVLALVEAAVDAEPAEAAMVNVLAEHKHAVVLDVAGDDWRRVAGAVALLGTAPRACAALAVATGIAEYVVTCEPDAYPGLDTISIASSS